ncbi:MAG: choice-of-anchor Q domain-containing protein, partial [Wenzhouxiangella sp.]|nr:choice-of-anchor Q domain-containing protein [Wenzhouxiangella sp.]
PNGTWILRFEDGFVGDSGDVVSAALELTVQGVTRTVTANIDSGPGSLRDAITSAQPGDRIEFIPGIFESPTTIELQSALPTINQPIAIVGPGAELLTIRRADNAPDFGIFTIQRPIDGEPVTLSDLAISNGRTVNFGGGVDAEGPAVLSGLHVHGNTAGNGGGLFFFDSSFLLIDSTIAGNRSTFQSGGVAIQSGLALSGRISGTTISDNQAGTNPGGLQVFVNTGYSVELINSTIVNNRADSPGGGVAIAIGDADDGTSFVIKNSIVSGNAPDNFSRVGANEFAKARSDGFNLSNDFNDAFDLQPTDQTAEPRLGPIGLYGGSVPVHPLLGGSPALDAGSALDGGPRGGARGQTRVVDNGSIVNPERGNGSDIGAVEMRPILVTTDADSGPGSLRQAITDANENGPGLDDIQFDPGFFNQARSIDLASALPAIESAATINGPGARSLTIQRDASEDFRILTVGGNLDHVAISGLRLLNGRADFGGGIIAASPLSLIESIVEDNASTLGGGGGAFVGHNTWVERSALINNIAAEDGGGLVKHSGNGAMVRIRQSTITGNVANIRGGGMSTFITGGRSDIEIERSTIANNEALVEYDAVASLAGDGGLSFVFVRGSVLSGRAKTPVAGAFDFGTNGNALIVSRGFNLFTDDGAVASPVPTDRLNAAPGLGPLISLGSPTPFHPLLPTSDALDAGFSGGRLSNSDQRGPGNPRLFDVPNVANAPDSDGSDIGAIEFRPDSVFSDRFELGPQRLEQKSSNQRRMRAPEVMGPG